MCTRSPGVKSVMCRCRAHQGGSVRYRNRFRNGSSDAISSAPLPRKLICPSCSTMNSVRVASVSSTRTTRSLPLLRAVLCVAIYHGVADLLRHHDRRDLLEIAQLHDLVVHRRRNHGIESGRRVVEQHQVRLGRHRAPDADAAALAARQARRHGVDEIAQSEERQHLLDTRAHLVERRPGFLVKAIADVLRRR